MVETKVYKLPQYTKRQFVKRVLRKCCFPEYEIRKITDFVAQRKGEISYTHLAFYIHVAIETGFDDVSEILCFIGSLLDAPKDIQLVPVEVRT